MLAGTFVPVFFDDLSKVSYRELYSIPHGPVVIAKSQGFKSDSFIFDPTWPINGGVKGSYGAS